MKKTLTLLLLAFFAISYSQDISITKSDIFKDKKKNSRLSYALEDDDGGLITIRAYYGGFAKLKGYYIQYFNSDLKMINELDYEVDDNRIRNAFIKNGQLHLIEFERKKKEDKFVMYAKSTPLNKFKFTKTDLLSISEDNIKKFFGVGFSFLFFNNFSKYDGNHMGEVVLSNNDNFIAINFDIKNDDQETHKIFVFNSNFEKVIEQLIVTDIEDKYFEYNDITVDDTDGTVYFLGKSFENKTRKSKKRGEVNYHFELVKVDANGMKKVSFKDEDKFIGSLYLLNNGDKVVCVGFYGKKDVGRYNGVCTYYLDPDDISITNKKFSDFSSEFLTDKYGDRENKKGRTEKKGLKNVDFKSVFMMEDGEIVVNAEEFYITTHTMTDANGNVRTRTVYHFDDIMAIRLNADGSLKWSRNVNKKQVGFGNSSFTSLPVGDTSYFFINCSDNIKKIRDDRISFRQTKSKKSNLYVISIDGNGVFNYNKLIDDKDSKVYYKVNNGVTNLNKQSVILLGDRKKDTQILKLKI